jgi:hypothetical protein
LILSLLGVVSTTGTILDEALPVLKTILECAYDAAALVPLPFFLEASRTLLIIWEACEQLSVSYLHHGESSLSLLISHTSFPFNLALQSNRLSCLRIVERCAGMLYFVREQIEGVGPVVGKELDAAFHVFREVIFQVCSCYLSASALELTPAYIVDRGVSLQDQPSPNAQTLHQES